MTTENPDPPETLFDGFTADTTSIGSYLDNAVQHVLHSWAEGPGTWRRAHEEEIAKRIAALLVAGMAPVIRADAIRTAGDALWHLVDCAETETEPAANQDSPFQIINTWYRGYLRGEIAQAKLEQLRKEHYRIPLWENPEAWDEKCEDTCEDASHPHGPTIGYGCAYCTMVDDITGDEVTVSWQCQVASVIYDEPQP